MTTSYSDEIQAVSADWPLSVAVEELTGLEVLAIQAHYKTDMSDLGPIRLVMAVVYVLEGRRRRAAQRNAPSWADVEGLTLRQLNGYFPAEPVEADEQEPESDLGKGF